MQIELFRERGLVARHETGVFLEPSWVAVFMGQGITPRRTDPRTEAYAPAQAEAGVRALHRELEGLTSRMPSHREAIDRLLAQASVMGAV